METEGQSVQNTCSCGRETYGAETCRRCAAIERARERDAAFGRPHPVESDRAYDPANLPPPPTVPGSASRADRPPIQSADQTAAMLNRYRDKTNATNDAAARIAGLRNQIRPPKQEKPEDEK